ncbi:YggU family protein [Candidatus Woesearchaeota archaeon]|nr:YggU family protein [Candidatus Woesearchaeota archaeon]
MIEPSEFIKDNTLRILVKPNKRQDYILGYDYERKALIVDIKAPAEQNKANKEVVKFFRKILKKNVKIKSGHTSHLKVLLIH